MMGRTHSPAGALPWLVLAPALEVGPWLLALGAAVTWVLPLGADLDHPDSTSSRALWGPFHGVVGRLVARATGGHRAGMHSLMTLSLATMAGFVVGGLLDPSLAWAYALMGLVGWAGGIWPDMLTKGGVKILWPLSTREYGVRIFTVGKGPELVFRWVLYAGIAYQTWRIAS